MKNIIKNVSWYLQPLKRQIKNFLRDKNDFRIKCGIRTFFEGCSLDDEIIAEPIISISIYTLGISKIETKTTKKNIIVKITLSRPGILIGAYGETINTLQDYLMASTKKQVEIHVIEFDPFQ